MQIPSSIITLLIGMLLVLGGMWVGQNINLLPVDASVNAPIYDELFQVLFTIGTVLFVGIVGLLVFSLIRFRRRSDQIGDGIAIAIGDGSREEGIGSGVTSLIAGVDVSGGERSC